MVNDNRFMKNIIFSLRRASYRELTLRPFLEINNKIKIFNDYFLSIFKCLLFCIKTNKKINLKIVYCDGNLNTFNSKMLKFFFKKINYYSLWFNSPREIDQFKIGKNIKNLVFFFEQKKYILHKKYSFIIPYPVNFNITLNNDFNYLTSYISEVNIEISKEKYPKIFSLVKRDKEIVDDFIWSSFKKFSLEKISNFNFSLYTLGKIKINKTEKNLFLTEIYGLYKNRLRYLAIKKIYKKNDKKICLVGGTWEKYGFSTKRNNYDYIGNRNIYTNTKAPIDFGATSGEYPIYLRTYEILRNSSFMLQSRTRFSKKIFKQLYKEMTFSSFEEMLFLLKNISSLNSIDFFNKKKKLIKILTKNKELDKSNL